MIFSVQEAANGKPGVCVSHCSGEIPIDIATREGGDRGIPIVSEDPQSPVTAEFNRIADEIRKVLQ